MGSVIPDDAPEERHQEWLFDAIRGHERRYPALKMAFHPANGGYRHPRTAARLKAMGVRPGVPDVLLPSPSTVGGDHYVGLAIELKVGANHPTTAQGAWLLALKDAGWHTRICHGWQAAWDTIRWYLDIREGGA